jgi:hypothetical protein
MTDILTKLFRWHDGYRRSDLSEGDEISVMIEADEEIRRLRARLKQAVEVMRPFAERASKLDGLWKEHETDWSPAYGSTAITIGHLRAASQFIEEQTDADK